MSMQATVIGNLTADIELRISQAGKPWCSVRIASTVREKDRQSGEYVDSDPLYVSIPLYGEQAENAAASLTKGTRIIATGTLKNRSYKDNQGAERVATELVNCQGIGPELRWATAQVTRGARSQGSQQATGAPGGQGQPQWGQPAANAPQTGGQGFGGGFDDQEQPF